MTGKKLYDSLIVVGCIPINAKHKTQICGILRIDETQFRGVNRGLLVPMSNVGVAVTDNAVRIFDPIEKWSGGREVMRSWLAAYRGPARVLEIPVSSVTIESGTPLTLNVDLGFNYGPGRKATISFPLK